MMMMMMMMMMMTRPAAHTYDVCRSHSSTYPKTRYERHWWIYSTHATILC